LDVVIDGRVVERDAREVDRLTAQVPDLLDAVFDGRQHPQSQQVDLQEAGIRAGVLVPLAHLPAGHRCGLYGDELDEGSRGDHHAAWVLRNVPRQAGDLAAELGEGAPARRHELAV